MRIFVFSEPSISLGLLMAHVCFHAAKRACAAAPQTRRRCTAKDAIVETYVGGAVPFVGQVRKPKKDKWCDRAYTAQRNEIFKYLHDNQIRKTVFLTGDMHASYHGKATVGTGGDRIVIHELMSSPINQFTPNEDLDENFISRTDPFDIGGGVTTICSIEDRHFYGNHSNIMAIEVHGSKVYFRIYRTRKSGSVAKSGSFSP